MARKRKVANLMALAVLATVVERPMHRYEMASVMRARGKDRDMDVKWGSLYTVVQNLEKNGFVEPVEVTRQGARPERTVYRITEAGRRELVEWTRELISEPETEHTRFIAGLSVMIVLAPDDAIALLRKRIVRLSEQIDAQRAMVADVGAEVPRLFLVEDEYRIAMAVAEVEWTRSLVDGLSFGSFPMLDVWQRFHESGSLPTELAELAQRDTEHEEQD
ncbi:PadR family transcriptional regulator [Mycolicibacterium sp. P9-64]|uniref:PadR family transcriptional regulator n=1 Tax=Mycolicibacterium sp. P9-64 TaxID=2024612 RepID=UPI0011F026DC|nr:PadR family transcriptional regulator [Mycolicibacterium sp. P9-64]KAA0081705.1 PadR family transcriptional regulator [Mycolicibacterium sp. P9-64]